MSPSHDPASCSANIDFLERSILPATRDAARVGDRLRWHEVPDRVELSTRFGALPWAGTVTAAPLVEALTGPNLTIVPENIALFSNFFIF